jgi:hypothetical protein
LTSITFQVTIEIACGLHSIAFLRSPPFGLCLACFSPPFYHFKMADGREADYEMPDNGTSFLERQFLYTACPIGHVFTTPHTVSVYDNLLDDKFDAEELSLSTSYLDRTFLTPCQDEVGCHRHLLVVAADLATYCSRRYSRPSIRTSCSSYDDTILSEPSE